MNRTSQIEAQLGSVIDIAHYGSVGNQHESLSSTQFDPRPTLKSCLQKMATTSTAHILSHRGCIAVEGLAMGLFTVLTIESWLSANTSPTKWLTMSCLMSTAALLLTSCGFACMGTRQTNDGRRIENMPMLTHPISIGGQAVGTGAIAKLALNLTSDDSSLTVGTVIGSLVCSALLLTVSGVAPWISEKLTGVYGEEIYDEVVVFSESGTPPIALRHSTTNSSPTQDPSPSPKGKEANEGV